MLASLFVLFDGRLTGLQWAGLATILAGIAITTLGGGAAATI